MFEINYPTYFPDLAPHDYRLFDYINQRLGDEQNENFFMKSITKIIEEILQQKWIKNFNNYRKT